MIEAGGKSQSPIFAMATPSSEARFAFEQTLKGLKEVKELKEVYTSQEEKANTEIRTLELRLELVKQERSKAITNIQNITQSITQIEAVVHELRSKLCQINEMPNEILYQIFSDICSFFSGKDEKPAPLILGSVCSRWRSLVAADTSLWKILAIHPLATQLGSNMLDRFTSRMHHLLERGQRSQQTLLLLRWTPARHRFLHILFDNYNTLHKGAFKAVRIMVEQPLEASLDLEYIQANSVAIFCSSGSILGLVPIMRSANTLSINGVLPEWGTLPWTNLRILSLAYTNHTIIYYTVILRNILKDIFQAAPHMIDLVLVFHLKFNPNKVDLQPVQPISVSHSTIECVDASLTDFSFNGVLYGIQLDAPTLKKVRFRRLKRETARRRDTVVGRETVGENSSFYRPWAGPIHLVLSIESDSIAESAELVRWFPSVQTLEIEGGKVDTLLTLMSAALDQNDPSNGPLTLPKLTKLHIENTDLRGETLLAFLDVRLRHVRAGTPEMQALTNVSMYTTPGVTAEDWKLVTERLEEGRILNDGLGRSIVST